ncbi:MAG: hypothetical protein JW722_00030 [Demequinaceae bacterium]|nr:hypothetical protein [Demequinaceae bacterium]
MSPTDPTAAFVLVYDAGRRALTAVLENQGLRPTSRGGHIAVIEAVAAQLDPPLGPDIRRLNRLRSRRNRLEYPSADEHPVTIEEIAEALTVVEELVMVANTVLDAMPPWSSR